MFNPRDAQPFALASQSATDLNAREKQLNQSKIKGLDRKIRKSERICINKAEKEQLCVEKKIESIEYQEKPLQKT